MRYDLCTHKIRWQQQQSRNLSSNGNRIKWCIRHQAWAGMNKLHEQVALSPNNIPMGSWSISYNKVSEGKKKKKTSSLVNESLKYDRLTGSEQI